MIVVAVSGTVAAAVVVLARASSILAGCGERGRRATNALTMTTSRCKKGVSAQTARKNFGMASLLGIGLMFHAIIVVFHSP